MKTKETLVVVSLLVASLIIVGILNQANFKTNSLTKEQALAYSDQYIKKLFTEIINTPSITQADIERLQIYGPLIRTTIRVFIEDLYKNNGYITIAHIH